MPSVLEYIPPTDVRRGSLDVSAAIERSRREKSYRQALDYYEGKHDRAIPVPEDGDIDHNTYINLVRVAADRTATFLFPEMPRITTNPNDIEPNEWDKYLENFLKEAGGLKTLIKWALRGFLAGHTFLQVKQVKGKPKLSLLDPLAVTVYWRADDQADVVWYEMRYRVGEERYIRDFVKRDGKWDILTYRDTQRIAPGVNSYFSYPGPHGRENTQYTGEYLQPVSSTYELVMSETFTSEVGPLIDVPHLPHPDNYYGQNEFTEKGLQDAINRLVTLRNRIAQEASEPVDFLAGADAESIETTGGILAHPNEKANVTRLEMRGDMAGLTSAIDKLVENYLAIMRVVLLKGDAKDLQRVTNASVRTLFLDALAKNEIIRSAYSDALISICKVALEIGYKNRAIPNPASAKIEIHFASPLPVDMTETANIIALAMAGGYMSKRTAAGMMNLSWAFEEASLDAEYEKEEKRYLTKLKNESSIKNESSVNGTLALDENVGSGGTPDEG